jgi:hypothetical protein
MQVTDVSVFDLEFEFLVVVVDQIALDAPEQVVMIGGSEHPARPPQSTDAPGVA